MMAFSSKHCSVLLALVTVCIQLVNGQFIPGARCVCQETVKFTKENITDFKIIEAGPGCDITHLIITLQKEDRSENVCLDPEGKLGKAFRICWDRINRDENMKTRCLNRRRKSQ